MKYGKTVMIPNLRGSFEFGTDMDEFISLCTPRVDLSPAYCHVYMEFPDAKWNPLCYVSQVETMRVNEEGEKEGTGIFNPKPPLTSPSVFQGWLTYDEFDEAMKWNPTSVVMDSF